MLDSFEKESKLQERRAARQRQMRLMEEAASGLPLSVDDAAGDMDYSSSLGTSGADPSNISHNNMVNIADAGGFDLEQDGRFSIDGEGVDDPAPPTSMFSKVSDHLWTPSNGGRSGTDLDEHKMGFVMGDDNESYSSGAYWRDKNRRKKEHDESRELILQASRRLSDRPREASNLRSFDIHNNDNFDDNGYKQNSRVMCPTWCLLNRRLVCALSMIFSLVIVLVATLSVEKNQNDDLTPWPPIGGNGKMPTVDNNNGGGMDFEKFNRIKDRILEHQISHASTLEDTNSSQYKALTWLVRDDKRQLDLISIDDEGIGLTGSDVDLEETLFQRYALAVLWYQTTTLDIVKATSTSSMVVSDSNPFDNTIEGETSDASSTLSQNDITWKTSTNWLSDKGLCVWHGITCHPYDTTGVKFDGDFHVAILNLTDNNVNGVLPNEVFTAFVKMNVLDLSRNELAGSIGREIGRLIDLQDLFLSSNHFTGVIPNEIGNLGSLFNLYINDNNIRGSIPSLIGELTKLRGVSMFDNKIEGRIPDEIGNLKDIVALYLDTNKLTGQIPTTIGKLTKMVDLRLRVNNLSGTIPTELGALGNLEVRLKERVLVHDTIELTPGALCLFFQPTDVIP
jgi:hypothetical protein